MEEWRSVVGLEDRYEVSNLGRVRCIGYWVNAGPAPGKRFIKARMLKPGTHGGKYLSVHLRPKKGFVRVHKLVMEAFVGPCPEGMEVCHNDDDGTNPVLSNLRYDTHHNNCLERGKIRRAA